MIPLIILTVITLAMIAESVLKPSFFKHIVMLFAAVCGIVFAFTFYEALATVITRIKLVPSSSYAVAFVLLFAISFAILKLLGDFTIRPEVKMPAAFAKASSIICSIIFGVLATGAILVFLSLMPINAKYPYDRLANAGAEKVNASKSPLNMDGMVTGLYNMVSAGSFAGKNEFGAVHANFLDNNYLNRAHLTDSVSTLSGKDAVKLSTAEDAVRKAHTQLKYSGGNQLVQHPAGKQMYIVTVSLSQKSIESGGIVEDKGGYSFAPGQFRLLSNRNYAAGAKGDTETVYPAGHLDQYRKLTKFDLANDVIDLADYKQDNKDAVISLAFYVSEGYSPVALSFRHNVIKQLPKEAGKEQAETE